MTRLPVLRALVFLVSSLLSLPKGLSEARYLQRRHVLDTRLAFGLSTPELKARKYPPAVAPRSQPPTRVYERIPAFPETPAEMVEALCDSMVQGLCQGGKGQRLRVELQHLKQLAPTSEEWQEAVGGVMGYLPFYEQLLVALEARGYKRVLAVFSQQHEAVFIDRRLKRRGGCSGYQVEFLQGRAGPVDVGLKQLVLLFHPRTLDDDYAPLTEFQRIAAVATLRGTGLVAFNPRLQAYAHHPGSAGGFGGMPCVPMVLSDFRPIFFLSAHTRPANPRQAYAVLMRTGAPQPKGKRAEGEQAPWPYEWEVYALDQRLPGSGWAFLESGPQRPLTMDIEDRYYDPAYTLGPGVQTPPSVASYGRKRAAALRRARGLPEPEEEEE